MPGCSAYGCRNRSEEGFKMKRFPRKPDLLKLWLIKVRRADLITTHNCYLCEVHFDDTQFERNSPKLKKDAVPTIFAHTPPPQPVRKRTKRVASPSKNISSNSAEEIEELKTKLAEAYSDISKLKKENLNLKNKLSEIAKSTEGRAQNYIIISKGFT